MTLINTDQLKGILLTQREVYVDPAGNDNNDGLTTVTPWATMARFKRDLESYIRLSAVYVCHLQGTGNLANVDLTVPVVDNTGSFNIVCDTYTVLAGPFTTTAITALNGKTLTVAGGLGINTWRGRAVRMLTGANAVNKYIASLRKSTDTVATIGVLYDAPVAIGDTFDIVEPTISLTGTVTWAAPGNIKVDPQIGTTIFGYVYLKNIKFAGGTVTISQGTWIDFGLQLDDNSISRLFIFNAVFYAGYYPPVPLPQFGQVNVFSWYDWGLTQPVAAGIFSVFNIVDSLFAGVLVAPLLNTGQVTFYRTYSNTLALFDINLFGGNGSTLVLYSEICFLFGEVGGNFPDSLIKLYDNAILDIQQCAFNPGAAVLSFIKTQYSAIVKLHFNLTVITPLVNVGSYAVDARLGGKVVWGQLPNLVGVAGDSIVDVAAIPNATFAAAGIGVLNQNSLGLVFRET